jgi:hypothetical protein
MYIPRGERGARSVGRRPSRQRAVCCCQDSPFSWWRFPSLLTAPRHISQPPLAWGNPPYACRASRAELCVFVGRRSTQPSPPAEGVSRFTFQMRGCDDGGGWLVTPSRTPPCCIVRPFGAWPKGFIRWCPAALSGHPLIANTADRQPTEEPRSRGRWSSERGELVWWYVHTVSTVGCKR